MTRLLKRTAFAAVALTCGLASAQTRLQGAGATFPAPLYQKWVADYQKLNPDIRIDYQAIGSGGGIRAITDQTVAFAGSDAPMNKKELQAAGGPDVVVQVPSVAGGVVPAYNIPSVKGELRFTGKVLAEIYMGKIAKWNDSKLTSLNPDANLPDLPITPAYRTDGSGTTYVWTNYLATQNDAFAGAVGIGKAVAWPLGQGGKGNAGVAAIIQQTPGAIGYVEQAYADQNHLSYGSIQNKNGKFIKASPQAVSAAGTGAVDEMKGHVLAANLWNQPGDDAYPAGSFTYLIVYKDLHNLDSKEKAQALVDFLWWATHDGQKSATGLDYAPLAPAVQQKVESALKTLTYKGASLRIGQ
jgi:phosphate transport system substrate-binding protein